MKKTVKTLFVILVLLSGIMPLIGCASKPKIPDNLVVDSDLINPFQGTWVATAKNKTVFVIQVMNATMYTRAGNSGSEWKRNSTYIIEERNGAFFINNMRVSISNDVLTVGDMTYERYKK